MFVDPSLQELFGKKEQSRRTGWFLPEAGGFIFEQLKQVTDRKKVYWELWRWLQHLYSWRHPTMAGTIWSLWLVVSIFWWCLLCLRRCDPEQILTEKIGSDRKIYAGKNVIGNNDYVFTTSTGKNLLRGEWMLKRPGWKDLKAVKEATSTLIQHLWGGGLWKDDRCSIHGKMAVSRIWWPT